MLLALVVGGMLSCQVAHADDKPTDPASEKSDDTDAKSDSQDSDSQDEEKAESKKKAKKRKTATVEVKPVKVEVTADAVFVSEKMTEIALRPESWSGFKIEEIIPHGSNVSQGQLLVKFDGKKLDEEIASLELSQRLADLSIRKAEQELPRLEKTLEMNLADAEQSHQRTHDDYQRYVDMDRDRYLKQLEMNLKSSKRQLDYARDELEQLEKMYKADDLTEETEELILTRTRQEFEMSEYYYELAKVRYERSLNISLPRQDEDNREVLDRVDISLERAKLASQIDLNRARYELEQQRVRRDRATDKHAKLLQDRSLMQLKAPASGIVYYGRCVAGKWSDMSSMIGKLKPHASVSNGTVMMTIIDPKPAYLLATVGEKEMPSLKPGQVAKIRPTAEGAQAMAGGVASVSAAPISAGKFRLRVDLTEDDTPEWLVPGMTAKIKVTTYHKKQALVVSKKAVHSEEDDEDKKYVWLVTGDDEDQTVAKQRVKVGKAKGDHIEILDGLDDGDVVSLEDEERDEEE